MTGDGTTNGDNVFNINITAVNDEASVTSQAMTVNEDVATTFTNLKIVDEDGTLTDGSDNEDYNVSATVTVANGTLTLPNPGTVNVTDGGNGTSTITFNGTLKTVNAQLAGMTYQGTSNFNGSDALTVTITDTDNAGSNKTTRASVEVPIT